MVIIKKKKNQYFEDSLKGLPLKFGKKYYKELAKTMF